MTEEDKQLLLKDLSARLPYGVKCKVNFDDGTSDVMKLSQFPDGLGIWGFYKDGCYRRSDNFKPYLRPILSSITYEERKESAQFELDYLGPLGYNWNLLISNSSALLDWLNAHHFDYRGVIEKGLALEAPRNMYIF